MKSKSTLTNPQSFDNLGNNTFLDKNENPFPLPPSPMEEIRDLLPQILLNRYPESSYRKLRECLSSVTGFPPENIIVGNGGDEILWLLYASYVKAGDKVLTMDPSFSEYSHLSRVYNAEQRTVPIVLNDGTFSLDEEDFIDSLSASSPSLVLIDSPNNPTGISLSSGFLDQVTHLSPGITVIDEAYGEFASQDYLKTIRNTTIPHRTVILKTLSKAWGLAGVRLGYAICSDDVAYKINEIRCPYNVNVLSQEVARIMLSYSEWMESRVSTIRYIRDKFITAVNRISKWRAFPSNSNFVLLQTGINRDLIRQSMENQGIHIKYVDMPTYPGTWLRISVGKEEDMSLILEVLVRLSDFVNKNDHTLENDLDIA